MRYDQRRGARVVPVFLSNANGYPLGALGIELLVDNKLDQANLYPQNVMRTLVEEITRYFTLRDRCRP